MTPDRVDAACGDTAPARSTFVALLAAAAAAAMVYGPALAGLWREWIHNPDYSHGILVAPIAAFLAWNKRGALRAAPAGPSWTGLAIVIVSLLLFVAGTLAAEVFTTRVSFVGVLIGTVAYTSGWRHVRIVAFPILFLLFMIPLPAILFDRLTASMQLVASGLGTYLLQAADVAVLRDGNVLSLSTLTLNVTEACSGIRSLMSLLTLTSLVAYLTEPTRFRQALLTLSAFPLAIALNGLRVAVTGIAALRIGPEMAQGAAHEATGWVMFVLAAAAVWLIHAALDRIAAPRAVAPEMEAA